MISINKFLPQNIDYKSFFINNFEQKPTSFNTKYNNIKTSQFSDFILSFFYFYYNITI